MLPHSSEIDLRKEFEVLQNEFSIDILYIRATKFVRCKCFNMLHQIGEPSCPICLGTGHLTTIEKTRAVVQSINSQRPEAGVKITELGLASNNTYVFYVSHKVKPKDKDLFVVTAWNDKGLPQEVVRVCEVVAVEEVRGESGRVELYGVTAKIKPESFKQVSATIKLLSKAAKEILSLGKRYIWPLRK